jgi:hypothetical protein
MGTPLPSPERKALDVTVMHGCCCSPDRQTCLPAGHCLSRAQLRHLRESDWVVVTEDAVPVALAAYKRVASEVRVVHELLLDRTLADPDAARVTEVLLSALEMVAYDDGVRCLTFLLRCSVVMGPFEQRGYMSLVLDSSGMWLQKKLGWLGWCEVRSERPN